MSAENNVSESRVVSPAEQWDAIWRIKHYGEEKGYSSDEIGRLSEAVIRPLSEETSQTTRLVRHALMLINRMMYHACCKDAIHEALRYPIYRDAFTISGWGELLNCRACEVHIL